MISFIVPAHNEELWIGSCLFHIQTAMAGLDESHEVIVVDDSSTDATGQLAEQSGARVIRVENRLISATRNAGAREAKGEILFFVDADTLANQQAILAALQAIRGGAVGGGCLFEFDRPLPFWGRILYSIGMRLCRMTRLVGGCFLFCTRQAFDAIGGFSERFYAGEEMAFAAALKREGRFVVPQPMVITSGRKLDVLSFWELIPLLITLAVRGPFHESRAGLDLWYGKRAQDCKKASQVEGGAP